MNSYLADEPAALGALCGLGKEGKSNLKKEKWGEKKRKRMKENNFNKAADLTYPKCEVWVTGSSLGIFLREAGGIWALIPRNLLPKCGFSSPSSQKERVGADSLSLNGETE